VGVLSCAPQQKPLDTSREKSNILEDIVVDNPWEGSMSETRGSDPLDKYRFNESERA
jgi:hypothetical protein